MLTNAPLRRTVSLLDAVRCCFCILCRVRAGRRPPAVSAGWRLRRGSVLAFAVLLVAAVVGTVVLTSQQPVALPAWSLFNKGIPGGEENQRIEFLQKYGWEAEVPPISEEEIVIPAEWDEVYTGYASLQQAQGFNLDKLRGKTVTEYTYHITNYPEKDEVAAHILVYKDRIVGADISEMEQGGFCMEVIPG